MQRNRFLTDMLSTLFDRTNATRTGNDSRDIYALCAALLTREGDVSGDKLAAIILCRYRLMSDADKVAFFTYLNDALDIDSAELTKRVTDYAAEKTPAAYKALTLASISKRQKLLRRLNHPDGATADLVSMRVDLLRLIKDHPDLARTDLDFVNLLRMWFNSGFLVLKQIDWDAPASLLEKIVAYEAVHEINNLADLRRRLSPPDRRCFAFFHPSMPDEPLIFVDVALTVAIPNSVHTLLSQDSTPLPPENARVAAFYSISNCQAGLKGISFGNLLIKQVARELALQLPQLTKFATLSPLPGLSTWLTTQLDDTVHGHVAGAVLAQNASNDDIRAMTARYLLAAKRDDNKPIDPVARFHLGNGAEVHAVHADADLSDNGRAQSCGAMVNYLYDLSQVEKNHEAFEHHATIAASKSVKTQAKSGFKAKPADPAS